MSAQMTGRLEDKITWEFLVIEQGHTVRYGVFAGEYYRQVLPAGIHLPDRHPPKKIHHLLYEIASKRQAG